jgi:hypothetical protein
MMFSKTIRRCQVTGFWEAIGGKELDGSRIYFPSKKLAIDAPSNSFLSPVVKHVFTYAHPHPISLPSIYCPAAAAAV